MSASRVGAWVLSLAMTGGLAALSRGQWQAHRGAEGALRLTWSARPEQIETCRRLGAEELAGLPAHMRQQVICEGTSATYRLRVRRGEVLLEEDTLHGSGFRRDRPMHVLRDYTFPPGEHRIRIEVDRVEAGTTDSSVALADSGISLDRGVREAEERQRRRLEAIPATLSLDETITVAPREVVLVTWDPDGRRLRMVRLRTQPAQGGRQ
jgi:hypothetical protein